jgi:hypothetical protein
MREWYFLASVSGMAPIPISGISSKAAQILEEGNGSLERQRERERAGWEGAGRGRSVLEVHPNPSHSTKMLGKMPLTKKAHKKSLTSKSKV